MALFICVVNHNHDKIIYSNETLKNLASIHTVFIKSNTVATSELINYCEDSGIHLLQGKKRQGFGTNNNEVFTHINSKFKIKKSDYFLVLNPDIQIQLNEINKLLDVTIKMKNNVSTINLFKDPTFTTHENSIRRYPKPLTPIKSIFGLKRNDFYNKSKITTPKIVDWASGSFLLFNISCYQKLGGFDENYFMYFEDVDICTRANRIGIDIVYYPHIKGIHYASHQNRKIFSIHFIWYCKSAIRYHSKYNLTFLKQLKLIK
ncbi:glycosyl transferase [Candidatus Photodesmus blepharus]|uniref:Glycosyl transferase n=1 Tax=Candidatus Photodesmus blepharonis TaxID=1179155 RepID=A0A084CNT8_9GAMM|nr:glycosyltransferase family 2 protein [Candidatus Photodesmus blepharus]KEY91467.1 glycosyl transferase [Candidatus Photodesmus blepharus]